jgi:hypothetical protein
MVASIIRRSFYRCRMTISTRTVIRPHLLLDEVTGELLAGRVADAYVTCSGGGGDITGLAPDVDAVVPYEFRAGVADSVDDIRRAVGRVLHGGADFVKLIATAVMAPGRCARRARAHRGTDPGRRRGPVRPPSRPPD